MKTRSWKKLKIFSLLVVVLIAGFFIVDRMNTKAATDEIWINIDGNTYGAADTYTVQSKDTTLQLGTNSTVYANDGQYQINWVIANDPTGLIATTSAVAGTKMSRVLTAKGVGEITLVVEVIQGGATLTSTSCKIKVGFAVDKSDSKFQKVFDTDTVESLVLYAGETIDLEPIFAAPNTYYESNNEDIVTCDQNTGLCTAVGAGPTTITATYADVSGSITKKYSDTINVYVIPQVSKDNIAWQKSIAQGDMKVYNGASIFVDAVFNKKASHVIKDKIIWVIEQEDGSGGYTPIANSLGLTSPLAKITPQSSTSNEYIIDAKAGEYRIGFWTSKTYKSGTNNTAGFPDPAYVNITVYASFSDYNINLVVGDSYSIPDAFNLDLATFKKLFVESNPVSNQEFITYDQNTGVVATKGIKGVATLTFNPNAATTGADQLIKDLYPGVPVGVKKSTFVITITIVDSFALSQSSSTMYVNATMDLIANSSYEGGTVKWSSSNSAYAIVTQNGKVTALKATDTTDSNPDNDSVTIKASLTMTNGTIKTATCVISIVSTINNLTLNTEEAFLPVGETKTITASFTPENSSASLIWVSSDPSVVDFTVSSDKRSIVVTGKTVGTTIIVVMNEKNMVYTTCKIIVSDSISSLTLLQTQVTAKKSQEYLRLKVNYQPSNAEAVFLWQSSNTSVATVDDNGMVTLVSAGNAIISVKPAYNPNFIQAQCNLTVTESSLGITLNKSTTTIEATKTETIEYVLTPANATTTITWKSLDTTIATVSSKGVVTAKASGRTYVTATTSEGYSAMCSIVVTQAATGIILDVYDLTLGIGDVYHVLAVPTPAGSTEVTMSWTSKDPTIATVTDSGKVTGVKAGSTIILIKTKAGKVEYLYVTVKENLKGMTLNYATKSVAINKTFTLKPVFTPTAPTNDKVTWKSTDSKIASVSTAGVVKGLKGGTTIITCTSVDGGYVATCIVTVDEIMTSITLNKSSYRMGVGKSVTLNATIKTNTSTNQTLRWTSSNTKVATVNSKGKIIAKKLGTTVIRVKATDGSGEQATCTIYVVRQATSIKLDKQVISIVEGRSTKLKATIYPSNTTYRTATWTSSDKEVAVVDSSGRVTGVKAGSTATIKATTKDNSNKVAYCIVKVIKEVAASGVIVSSKDMTLIKGQTGTVSVSVQPSNTTDTITYASDNRVVATVTNTGKITARRSGIATITITTTSGKQATVNITVVGLNKTSLVMDQYDTEIIEVEGATKVSWFSANPGIATVDQTGKITAKKAGTTTIYASINGIRLACKVRVKNMTS